MSRSSRPPAGSSSLSRHSWRRPSRPDSTPTSGGPGSAPPESGGRRGSADPPLPGGAARSGDWRCSRGSTRSSTRCGSAPTSRRCWRPTPPSSRSWRGSSRPTCGARSPGGRRAVSRELLAELVPQAPRTGVVAIARRPPSTSMRSSPARTRRRSSSSRTRGRWATWAPASGSPPPPTPRPCSHHRRQRPLAPRRAPRRRRPPFRAPGRRCPPVAGDRPAAGRDRPRRRRPSPGRPSAGAILAFGTERHGLTEELLDRADARLGIPMRAGVSSLNLATAVAAVLFAQRL